MKPSQLVELMRETAIMDGDTLAPFPGETDWLSTLTVLDNEQPADREWLRLVGMAVLLAPTVEIADALLRGESVPLDQLDQRWVRRYGMKAER
jgi:hypothetical protein